MKILVLGGTRFFGIHMVNDLIEKGHEVTIATRGITPDYFGDSAPYNGEPEYSINTDKAESLGFSFSYLNDWIYGLLDLYIDVAHEGMLGLYDWLD